MISVKYNCLQTEFTDYHLATLLLFQEKDEMFATVCFKLLP